MMTGLLDNRHNTSQEDTGRLLDAGIQYLQGKEYTLAFLCLDRTGKRNLCTLYNKALCCYHIGWFEECRLLLLEAERQLLPGIDTDLRNLPEMFARWEYGQNTAFNPMPDGAPPVAAAVQVLKLKAENAYRMRLYSEVKSVAVRLGGKYKWINELIRQINDGDL